MKLSEFRKNLILLLEERQIERASYVVDLILAKHLHCDRSMLITRYRSEVLPDVMMRIKEDVKKRENRVPLSYILGEAEFYTYSFRVGPGCLIPRPETELLVEGMLSLLPQYAKFADWCTGSGCIGITLLRECENSICYGVDASPEALHWASENASLNGVENRFISVLNSVPAECDIPERSLDFIIANPPYIPSSQIEGLMKDVRDYEPLMALDGGEEGIDLYRELISEAGRFVRKSGFLAFETSGDWQIDLLQKIIPYNFVTVKEIFDYAGIKRHIIWQMN